MIGKILCVDDEPKVLSGIRRSLGGGFDLALAEGPQHALQTLASEGPFAIVLSDMRMPGMDGAQLLAKVQHLYPDTVRIMLTGNSDLETATRAVNEGNIFRFLNKPCGAQELKQALKAGLEQHRMICAEREILEHTLNGCIKVLTEILSLTDPESFRHSDELKELGANVARHLDLPRPWEVEMATMLAALGRVTIPADLLSRADSGATLDTDERRMIASIPAAGASLIAAIPRLEGVAEIVRQQAQDWSPGGAPLPLVGARILRTLQDMMLMESSGLSRKQALVSMAGDRQGHDPEVVAAVAFCVGVGIDKPPVVARQIAFANLRPGTTLAAPLVTMDGRMMLREGHRIGPVLLERLRNHQLISGFKEPIFITQSPSKPAVQNRAS